MSFPTDKDLHVLEQEHVQLFLQVSEQESHFPECRHVPPHVPLQCPLHAAVQASHIPL